MRIATTGATGFIGQRFLAASFAADHKVTAIVRDGSTLAHHENLDVVSGDLSSDAALGAIAEDADVFVHLAGVTHPRKDDDYTRINVEAAERAAKIAQSRGAKFIHISSLSAREPNISPLSLIHI